MSSIEQPEENVWQNDLLINRNHIKNFQEDFKVRFKDLLNIEIPEWIIFPFDVEVESKKKINALFEEEFIEMTFDLEVRSKYIFKGIEIYRINKKLM